MFIQMGMEKNDRLLYTNLLGDRRGRQNAWQIESVSKKKQNSSPRGKKEGVMDQDVKDFVEKVKDEFKKVRIEIDSLKASIPSFVEKVQAEIESLKREVKDDSWF